MANLAPELLHAIVSQVALSYVYYPEAGVLNKDLGTLRSLRLANRKLSEVASEYLFEELTLYFTEASHAKMLAIAQHPTYSACVRKLGVSPKAIFGPFMDRNAFGQWFRRERCLVLDDHNHGFARYFYVPKRLKYLPTKEAGVIDFHHAEYTILYRKQEELFRKAGDILETAIRCFSRLEQVESSVRTPSTTYRVSSIDNATISHLWQDLACLHKNDLDHGVMILTAVSRGRCLAATQIDVSQLFYKMDTMIIDIPDPVASEQIQRLVVDAKKINFSIQSSDAELQWLLHEGKCAEFLGSMKKLESLACSIYVFSYGDVPRGSVHDIFRENTWQNLRVLELARFLANPRELANLFSRHRSTLQTLNLQHIALRRGSWHDVFVKLRRSALHVVKVHHLGGEYHSDIFFDDVDMDEHHLDAIPPSHPLHAFLFEGALWEPGMDDILEGTELLSDVTSSDATDSEGIDSEQDFEEIWEDSEE